MRQKIKRSMSLFICIAVLCCAIPVHAKKETVKISEKEYAVILNEAANVFIGNKQEMDGKVGSKVFFTYTVEEVTLNQTSNDGVVAALNNGDAYPYENGGARYWSSGSRLFEQGYTYVFRLERTENGFEYQGLKMKGDKISGITFTHVPDTLDGKFIYYGIWAGGLKTEKLSAVLSHVRCYDEKGNNLGIESNLEIGKVRVYDGGEAEDYTQLQGGYYCEKTDTAILLKGDKTAVKIIEGVKEEVPYNVYYNSQLNLLYEEGKEIYGYTHMQLTDDTDALYRRLQNSKVRFVTGEEVIIKEANLENDYSVEKPEDPKKKDNVFKGWYLGTNEAYDFDGIITESLTLYAKWQDGDGNEYLAVDGEAVNWELIISVGVSVLIAAGAVVACIMLVKRRRKQDESFQQ